MSARGKEGEREGTGRGCKRAGEGGKRIRGKRQGGTKEGNKMKKIEEIY